MTKMSFNIVKDYYEYLLDVRINMIIISNLK